MKLHPDIYALLFQPGNIGLTSTWLSQCRCKFKSDALEIEQLASSIEDAYQNDDNLKDGLSRLAYFLMSQGRCIEAEALFKRDYELERQTWWLQLRHAECRFANGNFIGAEEMVAAIYAKYSDAVNGYASLAMRSHALGRKEQALNLLRLDIEHNRLSPGFRLNAAVLLAQNNCLDEGLEQVASAYAADAALRDGYARIGDCFRGAERYADALAFYSRDAAIERLTPAAYLIYAEMLANTCDWERAEQAVEKAYALDDKLQDGYAVLMKNLPVDIDLSRVTCYANRDAKFCRLPPAEHVNREARRAVCLRAHATKAGQLGSWLHTAPDRQVIQTQLQELEKLVRGGKAHDRPMRILNAELFLARPCDAYTQFHEIVLGENPNTPAPYIIDGGANIGMAIAYFKWLYPCARILAFEPNPDIHQICEANIRHNGWQDVVLRKEALWDRQGFTKFNVLSQNPMGSGVTNRLKNASENRTIIIPTCNLGTFLHESVDYLKLDIEAAETAALREAGAALKQVHSGFIEYHYELGQKNNGLGALLTLLENADFHYCVESHVASAYQLPHTGLTALAQRHWSCSVFFAKNLLRA